MARIIDEVKNLYKVIEFDVFRKTPGVIFDVLPLEMFKSIDSLDRVIHSQSAVSPSGVEGYDKPWYMHPFQEDNLIVLHGTRYVDIYTPEHGIIEHFEVTPTKVYKNGVLILEGSGMLVWPRHVFHRIISGEKGSASLNIATHFDGFNINYNFDIYDLDTSTGDYKVIKQGFEDQNNKELL